MGKAYREKFNKESKRSVSLEMRELSQRPGNMDEEGNPVYFTEQAHKEQCDVNKIIRKYDRNGLISHVSRFEAQFGDVSGLEFKAMQDKVLHAKEEFNKLPSKIRNRFQNSPQKLLQFMDDANNRDEAIELGLINPQWTPESDGLGEHVKLGENVNQPPPGE